MPGTQTVYIEALHFQEIKVCWRTVVALGLTCFYFLSAYATGPPMGYDQWTTVAGTGSRSGQAVIQNTGTNECATGTFTCTLIAEDDGWRYELIETPGGEQYTRMLMTESAADGGLGAGNSGGDPAATIGAGNELAFTSETYTPMLLRSGSSDNFVFADDPTTLAPVAQGIAARQEVQSWATGSDFVSSAEIQRGFARGVWATDDGVSTPSDPLLAQCGYVGDWHAGPGGPTTAQIQCATALGDKAWDVKLTQTISDSASGIEAGFSSITYTDLPDLSTRKVGTDIVRGRVTDIWQDVTDISTSQKQKYDYRSREGRTGFKWYCGMGIVCGPYAVTNGGSITLGGTILSWNKNDQVDVAWIGSDLSPMGYTRASTANATVVDQNFTPNVPSNWPAAADADLNWALEPNVPDPFAGTAARTSPPAFP